MGGRSHDDRELLTARETGHILRVAVRTPERGCSAGKGSPRVCKNQAALSDLPPIAYVDDVAAYLGRKPKALRAAIGRGKFPPGRIIGGRRCWLREDLLHSLAETAAAGPSITRVKLMRVCTRPSPHNPDRVQVDMRFSCPDPRTTGKKLRIQRTAPEGYTADAAKVWARENADRFLAEIFGETKKEREQEEESKPAHQPARTPDPEADAERAVTLEQMYKQMEDRVICHEEPTSRDTWKSVWNCHLGPKFGQMPIDLITKTRILDWREELQKKKYAPSTCNHIVAKLQGILSYAVEKEKLAGTPTIRKLKAPEAAEKDPYTDEEVELLLAAAEGDEVCTLALLLSLDAGMRRNEMLALRWCDVDLRNSEVHIRHSMHRTGLKCPKGKKAVSVPMRARLKAELAKARKDRKLTDHVFAGTRNAWMSESAFRIHMIDLANRAGVEWRGFHKGKHTFITVLLEKGATLNELQLLARHKHASTTEGYMHVRNARKAMKAGIDRLDAGETAPPPAPEPERVRPKLRVLSS